MPNTGGLGNIAIKLGTHEHDCLGNITLCPNGATFSLWFKPIKTSTNYGTMFESTSLYAYWHQNSTGAQMFFNLNNGSHVFKFSSLPRVALDEWYHVGIIYSKLSGFLVYFPECLPRQPDEIQRYNVIVKNFDLGCIPRQYCVRVYFDDLRFWTVKKSTQFIRNLSNM